MQRNSELADIATRVDLEGTTAALNSYKFSGDAWEPRITFQGRILAPRGSPSPAGVPNDEWLAFATERHRCFSATVKANSKVVLTSGMEEVVAGMKHDLARSLTVLADWHARIYGDFSPCLDLVFYLVPPDQTASLRVSTQTDAGWLTFPMLGNFPNDRSATQQWTRDAIVMAAHEIFHLRSFQAGGFADQVSEEAAAYLQQRCVELSLIGSVGPTFVRLSSEGTGMPDRERAGEFFSLLDDDNLHPTLRGLLLAQMIFASDISSKLVELGTLKGDKLLAFCEQIGRARPPLFSQCRQGQEVCRALRGE